MIAVLRWLLAAVLLAVSLLAIVPVHALWLWKLSVGAKEYGQWFALAALAPLIGVSPARAGGAALVAAAALSAGLFLSSSLRGARLARGLPARLAAAFGPVPASRLPETAPFRFSRLWLGRPGRAAAPRSLVYRRAGGSDLSLRFLRAESDGPAPCILVFHTGGWNGGSPDEFLDFNAYLAARGYAVAAFEYRLAPACRWPAPREDALAAIAFLKREAGPLGLDPTRFMLLGRSAGGQIAEAVAYEARDPAIRGCIAFYSPADLQFAYRLGREDDCLHSPRLLRDYLGGPLAALPGPYRDASPIEAVGPQSPPTLLLHGSVDPLVWVRQSERLDGRLAAAGARHLLVRLPWGTHAFDVNLNGPGGQIAVYAVGYFLAAVMPAAGIGSGK